MEKEVWFRVIFCLFLFMVGIVTGVPLGMNMQQKMMAENIGIILSMSDVEVNIDFNETEFVDEFNKTVVPQFKEIFKEGLNTTPKSS